MAPTSPRTLVVIAGPTASGKTALSIWLAQVFKTEILSADSRQCYRELNIGVARPSPEELSLVPHHFIASHSINDNMNAGSYAQYGLEQLEQIFRHKTIALAVGGTGLYIKALTEGIDSMPQVDVGTREQIRQQYLAKGLIWLQYAVAAEDPLFWNQAEQMNPQRLMRALEFKRSTGSSIVEFRKSEKQNRDFNIIRIALELPREELYQRINTRVELMIEQGLENEVRTLYPLQHLNAMQTVGYKEWYPYFEGHSDLLTVKEMIQRNTRHYAKRQMTWFKRQEEFKWFSPADKENILSCIKSELHGPDPI